MKDSSISSAFVSYSQDSDVIALQGYVVAAKSSFWNIAKIVYQPPYFFIGKNYFSKLLPPSQFIYMCNINIEYALDRFVITSCHTHARIIPDEVEMFKSWSCDINLMHKTYSRDILGKQLTYK